MGAVIEHLLKSFDGHVVVNDVSFEVAQGELFVILGPSGSGKSTILRLMAGLANADGGRILLDGDDVTDRRASERVVGFVFQDYALFQNMTVAANIEFPLRIRGVRARERARRRDELLELVGLIGLQGRHPHMLSGGQRQRVALARALAHKPRILLLDEPFGALDAKIRSELRRSFRSIQKDLGITTILVTHDQEEAFELADRIGVMNDGRLLESGSPRELYLHPQTEFAATFLGKANLVIGTSTSAGVRLGSVQIPLHRHVSSPPLEHRVQVLFRPEDVAVKDSAEALRWPLLGRGVVEGAFFSGSMERLRLRLPSLSGVRVIAPAAPFGTDGLVVEATRSQNQSQRYPLSPGDQAWVGIRRIHALPHPGLSLLLLTDGAQDRGSTLSLGIQLGRLAHARVTVVARDTLADRTAARLAGIRNLLGAGAAGVELRASTHGLRGTLIAEARHRSYDLVVHPLVAGRSSAIAEAILQCGEYHLLMVPEGAGLPRRALICVLVGEPGKEDVLFAGRLVRHLGASATLLTVMPPQCPEESRARGRRFLAAGARTLVRLGVSASVALREGSPAMEIRREVNEGAHDLVVLGAPFSRDGHKIRLRGPVEEIVDRDGDRAILIIRKDSDWSETGRLAELSVRGPADDLPLDPSPQGG